MTKSLLCGLLALAAAGPAFAQRPSIEALRAQAEARLESGNAYQALLADPAPGRASAAMRIMLESGDPALQGMALDYGLHSPDAAVRRLALESLLAGAPELEVSFDAANLPDHIADVMVGPYGGSIDAEEQGYFRWRLGAWDSGRGCALDRAGGECAAVVTGSGVALRPWDGWCLMALDDESGLAGHCLPPSGHASSVSEPRLPMRVVIRP